MISCLKFMLRGEKVPFGLSGGSYPCAIGVGRFVGTVETKGAMVIMLDEPCLESGGYVCRLSNVVRGIGCGSEVLPIIISSAVESSSFCIRLIGR